MAFADASPRCILAAGPACKIAVKSGSTVKIGDPLEYSSGWTPAGASTTASVLVAGEDGASGESITAYPWAVIEGCTGGTAGAIVHLAANAAYAESGTYHVGLVLSATRIYVGPSLVPY
jgi:hypothetical protein